MKGKQRIQQRRSAARSSRRRQWLIIGVVAIVVVAGIVAILTLTGKTTPAVAALPSSPSSPDLVEETIPIQGRNHIEPGTPHEPYNSNPPTSGPHYADQMIPVPADFYDESNMPLDERIVHAEEHGYVVIWYNCNKAPNGDCAALKEGIRELRDALGDTKLIAVPRTEMDTMIAMTSWGKLQRFDAFDVAQISAFYHRNLEQGPEVGGP
jgi:Protein of unknown function (DUF3105)